MAISGFLFECIRKVGGGGEALSAGYPDMLIPPRKWPEGVSISKDSEEIKRRHRVDFDCPDSVEVFKALGYDLKCLDIVKERGIEIVVDLNHPISVGQYDLVVDCGTIEHCFNIAQAAINIASCVKVGGYLIQDTPCAMFNHGFYNLNPTWFHSFYKTNGFEIQEAYIRDRDRVYKDLGHRRFKSAPMDAMNTFILKRIEQREFIFPIQEKYRVWKTS